MVGAKKKKTFLSQTKKRKWFVFVTTNENKGGEDDDHASFTPRWNMRTCVRTFTHLRDSNSSTTEELFASMKTN